MAANRNEQTWIDHNGAIHKVIPPGKINRSSTRGMALFLHLTIVGGFCCHNCGKEGREAHVGISSSPVLEIDHIIPWRDGGTNHPANLQLLCPACNKLKTRWERLWRKNGKMGTPNDYRDWVKRYVPEGYVDCTFSPYAWPLAGQGGVLNA